jgi:ribosomal-protein-alanine N-acetyltransferase
MPLSWPDPLPAAGSVVLRPFRSTDLPLVAELSRDPYVPLIGSIPQEYSDEAGLAYLARQHQRLTDGSGYSFAIAERDGDLAVGGAGLWLHDRESGRATMGYVVARSVRRRGVASAALAALVAFAWTMADLRRLELYIEPWNTGSIRVAERCGFTFEVLLPDHLEIGGTRRDMLRYAQVR